MKHSRAAFPSFPQDNHRCRHFGSGAAETVQLRVRETDTLWSRNWSLSGRGSSLGQGFQFYGSFVHTRFGAVFWTVCSSSSFSKERWSQIVRQRTPLSSVLFLDNRYKMIASHLCLFDSISFLKSRSFTSIIIFIRICHVKSVHSPAECIRPAVQSEAVIDVNQVVCLINVIVFPSSSALCARGLRFCTWSDRHRVAASIAR